MAQAQQLEAEIATNSKVLDILAEQYDRAEQAVQDTAGRLASVEDGLALTQARLASVSSGISQAELALRQAAVEAYVNLETGYPTVEKGVDSYIRRFNQLVVDTALTQAQKKVQQLHAAQWQLSSVEDTISSDRKAATAATAAAQTAASRAQLAAQAAAGQQALLLNSTSQVKGNLATLVAEVQSAQTQAAFAHFSAGSLLDFRPFGPVPAPLTQAAAAAQVAEAQVGKPYVWGATGPDSFDCSGLTQWAWSQTGVPIPRVAADQQTWTVPVPLSQLAVGDLVFFGLPAHHVGMYVGNGMMVDAPNSGANISVVPVWWDDLAGFGRVHQP